VSHRISARCPDQVPNARKLMNEIRHFKGWSIQTQYEEIIHQFTESRQILRQASLRAHHDDTTTKSTLEEIDNRPSPSVPPDHKRLTTFFGNDNGLLDEPEEGNRPTTDQTRSAKPLQSIPVLDCTATALYTAFKNARRCRSLAKRRSEKLLARRSGVKNGAMGKETEGVDVDSVEVLTRIFVL
jgi:hypothetical protein